MEQIAESCQGVPAANGKTFRRSQHLAEGQSALVAVSAWAEEQRLVLGQLAVAHKSSKITTVPQSLEWLILRAKVVTADIMHDQRQLAQQLMHQRGEYVLALKGNQGRLHKDVRRLLDDADTLVAQGTPTCKGHGRLETSVAQASDDVAWLKDMHNWKGLQAAGETTTIRCQEVTVRDQACCYLMSTALSPEEFNHIVWAHRGVENGCTGSWE